MWHLSNLISEDPISKSVKSVQTTYMLENTLPITDWFVQGSYTREYGCLYRHSFMEFSLPISS